MPQIALTYDDGPNDPYTLQLLDVLAKHDVKATFFMIGQYVALKPDIARRVAADGHTIGNHTHTHPHLQKISLADAIAEIAECERTLTDIVGQHSRYFRPPYLMSTTEVDDHTKRAGLRTIKRTSSGSDWDSAQSVSDIVDKVVREQAGRSGVVVLHDGSHARMGEDRARTIHATERIIDVFKHVGFEFVADPVSALRAGR